MDQRLRAQRALFARKSRILWALAVVALLYAFAVRYLPTVADVLLLGDTTAGTAAGIGWLALNGAVLVLGWFVIVLGAIQLAGRAGH